MGRSEVNFALELDFPYMHDVKRYCRNLVKSLNPRAILIYGSVAKGTFGVGSDIDLLVISDSLPSNFLNRLEVLSELNDTEAPLEPLGYTTTEVDKIIKTGKLNPTVLDVLENGLVLYDDGYFSEVRSLFMKIKKKLGLKIVDGVWQKSF